MVLITEFESSPKASAWSVRWVVPMSHLKWEKKIPSINEFFYYLKDLILYQILIFTLKVFIEAYLT